MVGLGAPQFRFLPRRQRGCEELGVKANWERLRSDPPGERNQRRLVQLDSGLFGHLSHRCARQGRGGPGLAVDGIHAAARVGRHRREVHGS